MLQALRKFSKSWISSIFLGLIALSFALWGINDIFRGNTDTTAISVGSNAMSYDAFQREYQNVVRNQSRALGIELTPEQALKAKFPARVVEMTSNRLAKDNLAKALGLTVSDQQVVDTIRAIPAFNGPAGTFDHNVFLSVIGQSGFGEAEFLGVIRAELMRNQLEQAISGGFVLPPRLTVAWYSQAMQTRAAEYIVLQTSAAGAAPMPSDAELAGYVKKNAERFSTAQYREISYATLSPADVANQIPVSDADVKQEFEARKANYVTPEKREMEQISFPTEVEAKAGKAKLDGGMTFAALAQSRGLKPTDIAIGSFAKADLPKEQADAAFALGEGAVSQPVKGPFGWVLLRAVKVTPGSNKTLDDVKDDIRKALQTQASVNKLIDAINKFVDERAGGATIEQAAKKAGLQYGRVAAVDSQGLTPSGEKAVLPADPEFLTQAFSVEAGEDLEPVQAKSGNYFVLRVEGITPPKIKPLAEIREAATKAWVMQEQSGRLKAKAEALAAQATKEQTLANAAKSVGATVVKTGALTRMSPNDALPPATTEALFLAKPGAAVAGPGTTEGTYIVARVTGVSHPKLVRGSPEVLQAVQQMSGMIASDISDITAQAVQKDDGVKVNKALVAQATGEGS